MLSQEGDNKLLHLFCVKGLGRAECRYHVKDLEALAVEMAVRRFHMFIYGLRTVVLTDHQSLTALSNRSKVSARILKWSLELQRYNLEIKLVKGKTNVVASALSRGTAQRTVIESMEGLNEVVVNCIRRDKKSNWFTELESDGDFAEVVGVLNKGDTSGRITWPGAVKPAQIADFVQEDGDLKMYQANGSLVYVVPKGSRYEIFHEAHSGNFAGHFSAHQLLNRLRKEVFWPTMVRDIHKWTRKCQRCFAHNERPRMTPPLEPIVTTKPYEIVRVDVLELGMANGNRYVVTIIDRRRSVRKRLRRPPSYGGLQKGAGGQRWLCSTREQNLKIGPWKN
uniref:RNA-directed DNA polymerase n=1 Tax=Haemonchus contortus TaxID=6289 RepID=A0A7I4Z206_HAECO